jgi:hypothetical protein
MRAVRSAVVLVFVLAMSIAGDISGAQTTRSMTVTPSTGLVDQVVTITGSGFTPDATVGLCQAVPSGTLGQEDCRLGTLGEEPVRLVRADGAGNFSTTYTVRRVSLFSGALAVRIDCADAAAHCVMAASELSNTFTPIPGTEVLSPISFVAGPFLNLRPNGPVTETETLEVTGVDFPTAGTVTLAQCETSDPTNCVAPVTTTADSAGTFRVDYFLNAFVNGIDCRTVSGRCMLRATSGATAASRALTFAQPDLHVVPATGLVDGQSVTVTGTGWPDLTEVLIRQCGGACLPPVTVTTDADGAFSTSYSVRRFVEFRDCSTGECEIAVNLAGPGPSRFQQLTFTPVDSGRPDLIVRRRSDGTLFFNDVYDSPSVFTSQSRNHAITAGGKWVYALRIQNDGTLTDDFVLKSAETIQPPGLLSVRYIVGYYDITSLVTGGGFTFANMAPGEVRNIGVQFRADPSAPADTSTARALVTAASSQFPQLVDTLSLKVVVRA